MVVVDTNRPEENYRNLVEEQEVGSVIYRISDSYAPMLGNINKRISITTIDKNKINDYGTVHGIEFIDDEIRSYNLIEDKNRSTHGGEYLDDPMGYYQEVMGAFEDLMNSNNSEFTSKALEVLDEIKNYAVMIGSGKNAI